jgi:hypothetical protein
MMREKPSYAYIDDDASMHARQTEFFTYIAAGVSNLSERQSSTMIVVVR